MPSRSPKVVVLGGGTGSFMLLQALKELTPRIAAVVNMCDDGGSTGVLRDELGVLPPGDARQCLVALSESPEIRDLFSYRFAAGSLSGQSLGNIILSGLELQHGSFEEAVRVASAILRIKGKVLPVVLGDHKLVMRDGSAVVKGQETIRLHTINQSDARVSLEPYSTLNPKADKAIREADIVVIAPGGLYWSLLPVFSVNGIAEALQSTRGQVVYISNLVNKPGQTPNWDVVDYIKKIEEYIGEGAIDVVIYNTTPISKDLLSKYAQDGEYPVQVTAERFDTVGSQFVGAPLVSETIYAQDTADKAVKRTLIRHDGWRVKTEVEKLLKANNPK